MRRGSPRAGIRVVGFLLAVVYIAGLFMVASQTAYNVWGAFLVAPLLAVATLPLLAREARRQGNRALYWLMVLSLIGHFVAIIPRRLFTFADAAEYHRLGSLLSEGLLSGGAAQLASFPGTDNLLDYLGSDSIRLFTGLLYTVTRPSLMTAYVVFAWLGFLGAFFFFRAFSMAVPEGRPRAYAALVFFLPTMIFWPSSVGKEAWMIFALGTATLGTAHLMCGRALRGTSEAGVGIVLMSVVRPHIGAMALVALLVAFAFRPSYARVRQLVPVMKPLALGFVALMAFLALSTTARVLELVEPFEDVNSILLEISDRTSKGGSEFEPTLLLSPQAAPVAAFTVVFRPFVTEARTALMWFTALESLFLLGFFLARVFWIGAALRLFRKRPLIAFAVVFSVLFLIGFSSFANFGLLARERAQLFPFLLMLVAVPPASMREKASVPP